MRMRATADLQEGVELYEKPPPRMWAGIQLKSRLMRMRVKPPPRMWAGFS